MSSNIVIVLIIPYLCNWRSYERDVTGVAGNKALPIKEEPPVWQADIYDTQIVRIILPVRKEHKISAYCVYSVQKKE